MWKYLMTDCVKAAINLSVNAVIYKDCRKQVFVAGTERRHSSGLNFAHRFFFCSSLKMSFGSPIKNRNGREHVERMQMRSPSENGGWIWRAKGRKTRWTCRIPRTRRSRRRSRHRGRRQIAGGCRLCCGSGRSCRRTCCWVLKCTSTRRPGWRYHQNLLGSLSSWLPNRGLSSQSRSGSKAPINVPSDCVTWAACTRLSDTFHVGFFWWECWVRIAHDVNPPKNGNVLKI